VAELTASGVVVQGGKGYLGEVGLPEGSQPGLRSGAAPRGRADAQLKSGRILRELR